MYFIEAQGYTAEHKIVLQDNKSTILLATNGKFSSSKRSKQIIKNRFFLIKDKIALGEIEIQYEPTGVMWSDVLTKSKQGKAFRVFGGQLMNAPEDYDKKIERLSMHPDLLPPADDDDQLLATNSTVLVKTLK